MNGTEGKFTTSADSSTSSLTRVNDPYVVVHRRVDLSYDMESDVPLSETHPFLLDIMMSSWSRIVSPSFAAAKASERSTCRVLAYTPGATACMTSIGVDGLCMRSFPPDMVLRPYSSRPT